MSDLRFTQSWTIPNFKASQGVEIINISKNPETKSRYFDCGAVRGPVSKSFDSSKECLISLCVDEDGVTFHMLHNRTLANVVETL